MSLHEVSLGCIMEETSVRRSAQEVLAAHIDGDCEQRKTMLKFRFQRLRPGGILLGAPWEDPSPESSVKEATCPISRKRSNSPPSSWMLEHEEDFRASDKPRNRSSLGCTMERSVVRRSGHESIAPPVEAKSEQGKTMHKTFFQRLHSG